MGIAQDGRAKYQVEPNCYLVRHMKSTPYYKIGLN